MGQVFGIVGGVVLVVLALFVPARRPAIRQRVGEAVNLPDIRLTMAPSPTVDGKQDDVDRSLARLYRSAQHNARESDALIAKLDEVRLADEAADHI